MDSLTAMELRRRLQAALGTELPASLFFAHPTVTALAEGLLAVWLDNSSDKGEAAGRHSPGVPGRRTAPIACAGTVVVPARIVAVVECVQRGRADRHPGPRGSPCAATELRRGDGEARGRCARHSAASTGVPQAVLGTPQPFELPFEQVCEADVAAVAEREAAVPFDIAVGPLLRARLLGLGEQRHVLVLTMHHIVTDGWSFRVLLRDLGLIYQALERGEPIPLAELPIQYPDYAQWQRDRLRGADFDAHLDFWRNELAGAPPLELDTDRPRPKTPTFRGARTHFALGSERAGALRGLCRAENVTVSVPLLAAFAAVLARYSGQDDFVVGTLTANRTRVETEDLIGLFVNALPVRIRLDGDPDGTELLSRIRQRMVEVLAHQDVPFDLIVNATAPDRDANRNPLFGVQLVVQPAAGGAELSGLGLEVAEIGTHTAKRDLTFTFFDDDLLTGHVEYAAELFDAVRIDQLITHFRMILDAMVSDLGLRLSELPMLTESESAHYQAIPTPRTTAARSVSELFETTVDRVPDAVAVTVHGRSLTYRELDAAANRLARRLRNRGVDAGAAVALCVDRTAAMAIGMLGILKAGGVYVPIDPSYPKDRVDNMLSEAGVVLLLGEDDVDEAGIAPGVIGATRNLLGASRSRLHHVHVRVDGQAEGGRGQPRQRRGVRRDPRPRAGHIRRGRLSRDSVDLVLVVDPAAVGAVRRRRAGRDRHHRGASRPGGAAPSNRRITGDRRRSRPHGGPRTGRRGGHRRCVHRRID